MSKCPRDIWAFFYKDKTMKTIKTRIIHKHDSESNWTSSNFIPNQGELIVYDIDENYNYERLKIGDGTTAVSNLPFVNDIEVPTKTSQLENDSNFLSETDYIIFDGGMSEDVI